jgi:hypothetical protein
MKLFTQIYGSREYVRIHRNIGWSSDSDNFLFLRWVGGPLCFACSCYTVGATLARDAQTHSKLPLNSEHARLRTAWLAQPTETKWPLATNWSRRITRNAARRHTYSAFPYKQKYNTLLKVRMGVTPRYDCTRQLLCCGKACTAPRTKE